ncbi:hypothetical protein H696_03368 [Fonticula alba]|uniref:Mitochondrial import inner membrane translocase subunit n=1 Tax=Fonticula alba TaxID=691883 RepID=A0A058Z715_FONAL|nr:hypothetical protein H696_03368 [Fonticula alba]KCV69901.1 hypothetical protein H696_03368 [Fonticula alba]|eukprot:XP_009495507.1 hypothetical protein H696_03368 [Fonticula alba]
MSYFNQQQAASNQTFMQLEHEMEAMTDVFNKIISSCHTKCIPTKYSESDLNKAESVCVDRCFSKYMIVQQQIGSKLQELSQNVQEMNAEAAARASQ